MHSLRGNLDVNSHTVPRTGLTEITLDQEFNFEECSSSRLAERFPPEVVSEEISGRTACNDSESTCSGTVPVRTRGEPASSDMIHPLILEHTICSSNHNSVSVRPSLTRTLPKILPFEPSSIHPLIMLEQLM